MITLHVEFPDETELETWVGALQLRGVLPGPGPWFLDYQTINDARVAVLRVRE